jgi:sugar lactone lactonase YvrE
VKRWWRIPTALIATTALAVGGPAALADRGKEHRHGHGHKAASERLFTLQPDPAGNPEGIEFDRRSRAFFVSITNGGAIYRGTLDSDVVTPYIEGAAGRAAVGIEIHRGKLYVAGGATGAIRVYDLATKQQLASFETGAGGFLNDLVVTSRGDVYVTDSFRPTLWHVTAAQVGSGGGTPQALDVSAGIPYLSDFNLNGIVAKTPRRLVVVQSNTGKLFRIDLTPDGSAIAEIDEIEGVSLPGGDGMILDRGRLVVVQGGTSPQLAFVRLRRGAREAQLRGTRTSTKLNGPSTVAAARKLYLVVNADFAESATPFTVAGLPRSHRP